MTTRSPGLHHVTAIAGDPRQTLDFYAGTLGLRLVKQTVNFDDPETYHFYFGERTGQPGSLLTFFPWAGARQGRPGMGEVGATALAVPEGSLDAWEARLAARQVFGLRRGERFGEPYLGFSDPFGMQLELVERPASRGAPWPGSGVPTDQQVRGVAGVRLVLGGVDATAAVLQETLGFGAPLEEGATRRLFTADGGFVDLVRDPGAPAPRPGAGSVHHVAWRAEDDAAQAAFRGALLGRSLGVTPVVDRSYFRSIYFREPGGVLFEVATDGPGFLTDEAEATLGTSLRLPPQYEGARAQIEQALPALQEPAA